MAGGAALGHVYGPLAAAGVAAASAGIGAAVIGCGPIREWSPGIVEHMHEYIRREDYP